MNHKRKKENEKLAYYIKIWLERKQLLVKETTFSRYVGLINTHILPELGEYKAKDITDEVIANYVYQKLKNGNLVNSQRLSHKAVKDLLILLNQILRSADIYVKIPSIKNEKKDIVILNELELSKIKNYIANNLNNVTIGMLLSLYCGLRIGEVCALKWENIDLENKFIHIIGTLSRVKDLKNSGTKVIMSSPKTFNSKRTIPIPEAIIDLLKQMKGPKDTFVLTNNSKSLEPRSYYNKYKRILNSLGMGQHNYHVLRHSFATKCIEIGFDPKTLSEILGHANVKTTLSLYVHPSMELKISAMNKLNF